MPRLPFSELLLATGNRHKVAELKVILSGLGVKAFSPSEFRELHKLSLPPEVDENGTSFDENAFIKANSYCKWSNFWTLGDDSGLEVEALGGSPGIYSARYAGPNASDWQKCEKVLAELAGHPEPRIANFVCALSLCRFRPTGVDEVAKVVVRMPGQILSRARGDLGFGYDPIVLIDELDKTLAELDFEQLCSQGFRAKAVKELLMGALAISC